MIALKKFLRFMGGLLFAVERVDQEEQIDIWNGVLEKVN